MTAQRHQSPADDLEVVVFGGEHLGAVGEDAERLATGARQLLEATLEPALRDDRFDPPWPPGDLVATLAVRGGRPIGYIGGRIDRGRLQLQGLLAEDRGSGSGSEADRSLDDGATDDVADRLWRAIDADIASTDATSVELWAHPARPWHERLAKRQGLTELRALHQLRCRLPLEVDTAPLPSRPFVPGQDDHALLLVNNRAFASHPDQGGMTEASLADASAQPWFDPDGIRLHDDPDRPGVLAGFCWTKIHEPTVEGQPKLGEIYAIGIDPDHHGKGLGGPMTAAGLQWLVDQGLTTGMLYVEADNEPALRTYERLGFRHHRTDRAWRRDLSA